MKGTIGVRLALWYAGVFASSVGVVVLLTYALLASSLRQRDQEIVVSTLRDYAQRYEAGGLGAVVQAVETEQRAGTRERLFVRVLGRGQDLLFATIPPEWGSFDVDQSGGDGRGGLQQVPARNRNAVLELASARLWDGTLLQVGKSTETRELLLQRFRAVSVGVSVAILLVGGLGGYLLTRSTLAPVRELAAATRSIVATGRTDARVTGGDERRCARRPHDVVQRDARSRGCAHRRDARRARQRGARSPHPARASSRDRGARPRDGRTQPQSARPSRTAWRSRTASSPCSTR